MNVALPKGRYREISTFILRAWGVQDLSDKLSYIHPVDGRRFMLVKAADIAALIRDGSIDIGLAPDEWVIETLSCSLKIDTMPPIESKGLKYKSYSARISVFTNKPNFDIFRARCVATPYPQIAKRYFQHRGFEPRIIEVRGSTEAFVGNICDCGIDIVESGKTLRSHALFENDVIASKLGLSWIGRDIHNANFLTLSVI